MQSSLLGTPSKKIEKFGDFVLNSLTPTLPPLIGTKKIRTICSAFGPPPSFMKLGQNGEKNLVHKSIFKINFKPFKKLERDDADILSHHIDITCIMNINIE